MEQLNNIKGAWYQIPLILMIIHHVIFLFQNIMMYFVYTLKLPFFEKYRIDKNAKWLWEKSTWKQEYRKMVKIVFVNDFILGPFMTFLEYYIRGVGLRTDLESFPTKSEIFKQLIFGLFVEDCCYYWFHRIIHHKSLYWIHKIHHDQKHPITVSLQYLHPLDYILTGFVNSIGFRILGGRMHFSTVLLWSMYRIPEGMDAHCGYEFS